jgi:hypothetical protein
VIGGSPKVSDHVAFPLPHHLQETLVTQQLRPTTIVLDEGGHVYVPLVGPGGSCLRLNASASSLWRMWTAHGVDPSSCSAEEARFLRKLLESGAATLSGDVS